MCFSTAFEHSLFQRWLTVLQAKDVKNFGERGDHGGVGMQRHWADDDGVEIMNVCGKNVLHILNDLTGTPR